MASSSIFTKCLCSVVSNSWCIEVAFLVGEHACHIGFGEDGGMRGVMINRITLLQNDRRGDVAIVNKKN